MALTMRLMLDWYEYLYDYQYNTVSNKNYVDPQTFNQGYLYVSQCTFQTSSTTAISRTANENAKALFEECLFINCVSTNKASGIYTQGGDIVIDRNCFYNCQSEENGQTFVFDTARKKLKNSIYISSIVGCGNSEKRGVTFLMQSGRINISNINCTGNKGKSNTCCQLWSDISDSYIKYSTFYGNSQSTDTSLTLQTDQSTMAYVINNNFISNSVGEDPTNPQFYTTNVSNIIKCSFIQNGELLFGSRSGTMTVEKCFIDRKEFSTSGNVNIVSRAENTFFFEYSHYSTDHCEANDPISYNDKQDCIVDENCEHSRMNIDTLIYLLSFRLAF